MVTKTTESKSEIKEGLALLAEVVGSTMGPMGRNVLFQEVVQVQPERQPSGQVRPTKDGVTVAEHFVTTGKFLVDYGVMQGKEASREVRRRVGDGTTQVIELCNAFCFQPDAADNVHHVELGMRAAVRDVLALIASKKMEVSSVDELKNVAKVSANDHPISNQIAELVYSLGKEGILYQNPSISGETYTEKFDGFVASWGINPMFTNNGNVNIGDAFILLADYHLSDYQNHLEPVLNGWLKRAINDKTGAIRPLVIFCKDMDGTAMKAVLGSRGNYHYDPSKDKTSGFTERQKNVLVQTSFLPIFVVKVDDNEGKRDQLLDLACLLSENPKKHLLASWHNGTGMKDFTKDLLLECKTFFANKDKVIVSAYISHASERIERLKKEVEESPESELIKARLASLSGGIGIIHVGGGSPAQVGFLLDVVDDTQKSCFSALRSGYIPGGGIPLAWAAKVTAMQSSMINSEENASYKKGYDNVLNGMSAPMLRILKNACIKSPVDYTVNGPSTGYDVRTGEICDLLEEGIVDPFAAVEESLKAAINVGTAFVTTQFVITNES